MTRKEQLEYCKVCQKKQFDAKRGIVCQLTNEYADFEEECADFVLDEKIKALNAFKQEMEEGKGTKRFTGKEKKKEKTKLKAKTQRIKEQFTKNDWWLLAGFACLTTFIIRINLYSQFTYRINTLNLNFYLVVFIACIMAVFFRKSEQNRKWFFSDIKFKLLLAVAIPLLNLLYSWIIFGNNGYLFRQLLVLLVACSVLSLLSSIIIVPINIIINKFKHE